MEEIDGFEKLYQNLVNSIWEDVSLEQLVSKYRRCQHALVRILAQSHKGTQGRHKNHITYSYSKLHKNGGIALYTLRNSSSYWSGGLGNYGHRKYSYILIFQL